MPLGQWWKRAAAVTGEQKRNVIIGLSIAAAVGVVLWLVSGDDGYEEREAAADSREVQQSLEITRSIAQAPDNFLSYMVDDPNERAKASVAAAAQQMSKAGSIELKDAAWFGDYLRLDVRWPSPRNPFLLRETARGTAHNGRRQVTVRRAVV